jgi:hypothetical protein
MNSDQRLVSERFPPSSKYHPEWVIASVSGGANALWLTEWLAAALDLRPGMRVLDLGCGRAMSSIFLRREFGVQVWATDLWFRASENIQRIRDADVEDGVSDSSRAAASVDWRLRSGGRQRLGSSGRPPRAGPQRRSAVGRLWPRRAGTRRRVPGLSRPR